MSGENGVLIMREVSQEVDEWWDWCINYERGEPRGR